MFKVIVIDLSDTSVAAELEGDAVIASAAKIGGNAETTAITRADPFTIAKAVDGAKHAERELAKRNPFVGIACSIIDKVTKKEVKTDEP